MIGLNLVLSALNITNAFVIHSNTVRVKLHLGTNTSYSETIINQRKLLKERHFDTVRVKLHLDTNPF